MALISIDFTGLEANARELRSLITQLEAQQRAVEALIGQIAPSWTGAASEVFIRRLQEQTDKSQKLIDVLYEYLSYVNSAKDKFSNLERTISSMIRAVIN
ncbi:MAG: WXG100 family type VII secretion target [Candidatus Fimenecus sp.]